MTALHMLNLSSDQVIGVLRKSIFPPVIADQQSLYLNQIFETGEPIRKEMKMLVGTHEYWMDNNLIPLKNMMGTIDEILGIAQDISERKRNDRLLQESEEKIRLITETIDETFWMADVEIEKFSTLARVSSACGDVPGSPCMKIHALSLRLFTRRIERE